MYMGISAAFTGEDSAVLCMAAHDTVYLVDYAIREIKLDKVNDPDYDRIAQHAREMIRRYEKNNFIKFIGAGLPVTLASAAPTVCSRLWLDLDIVPIVIDDDRFISESSFWEAKRVDEQADSMARKCLMYVSPEFPLWYTNNHPGTLAPPWCLSFMLASGATSNRTPHSRHICLPLITASKRVVKQRGTARCILHMSCETRRLRLPSSAARPRVAAWLSCAIPSCGSLDWQE